MAFALLGQRKGKTQSLNEDTQANPEVGMLHNPGLTSYLC